jgi:DNA transformation protein and related proteins
MPGTGEVRAQDRPDRASTQNSKIEFRRGVFHSSSMPHKNEYLEYVLEQLAGLPGVRSNRMFSGAGLYQDEVFFGLLFGETLYFKVGDNNRPDYESRGMAQFRPYKDRPQVSFTYYEVPPEVLEDRQELVAWARRAVEAAVAIQAAKAAKRTPRKRSKRKAPKRKAPKRKTPGRTTPEPKTPKRRP